MQKRLDGKFAYGEIPGAGRIGGSSRQNFVRGTGDIETDYLNGEVVLLGRLHGIPTPANAVIQRLSTEFARRQGQADGIPPDKLRRIVEAKAG